MSTNLELELLLEDAEQTVIFLRNNDILRPDILIFSQAANIMEAVIKLAKPCCCLSASEAYQAAWNESAQHYAQIVPTTQLWHTRFLEWRDQQ